MWQAGCVPRPRRSRDQAADRSDADGPQIPRSRPGRDEPLAASWRPVEDRSARGWSVASGRPGADSDDVDDELDGEPRRSSWREAWSLRGWRVYAVPLLIAVSALAVFQAADPRAGEPGGSGAAGLQPAAPQGPPPPAVTEAPRDQTSDSNMFPAELPPGPPVPQVGGRTFQVLPGTSPRVGSGDLYRYTVEVEVGVQLPEGNDSFARMADQTLADPRSWTNPQAGGIALERVDGDASPDFRVTLVSQNTAREICGYGSGLPFDTSCRIGDRVYINAARWVRGAVAFHGDMGTYRQYAINHEVGHVFGNGHVPCGQQGGPAPVMMQQTFSTANNDLAALNEKVPQGTHIPTDGFVCKPNAWPFPVVDKPGP